MEGVLHQNTISDSGAGQTARAQQETILHRHSYSDDRSNSSDDGTTSTERTTALGKGYEPAEQGHQLSPNAYMFPQSNRSSSQRSYSTSMTDSSDGSTRASEGSLSSVMGDAVCNQMGKNFASRTSIAGSESSQQTILRLSGSSSASTRKGSNTASINRPVLFQQPQMMASSTTQQPGILPPFVPPPTVGGHSSDNHELLSKYRRNTSPRTSLPQAFQPQMQQAQTAAARVAAAPKTHLRASIDSHEGLSVSSSNSIIESDSRKRKASDGLTPQMVGAKRNIHGHVVRVQRHSLATVPVKMPPMAQAQQQSHLRRTPPKISVDSFELLRTIGIGTFGRVILAQEKKYGGYFAVKMMHKEHIVRMKQVEHFNSERKLLSTIRSPFIVRMFANFQDSQRLYFVLEYVAGGELFTHLRRAGRFLPNVARFYIAELTSALDSLHSQNIIYRDLKPENLLLDFRGHVKITDFGFAKHVVDRTWTLCGTPEYLAPEIIQSQGHGKAVDWWALGILTYEMLVGYPPFVDSNTFRIYEKILSAPVSFPSHIEETSKQFISELLTRDPTQRIGALVDGVDDVKQHPFFGGLDWRMVDEQQLRPPIVPRLDSPGDASNYDMYPEKRLSELLEQGPDRFWHLFE
eukprot:Clim_evm96s109 gene=Clim_evmTU96s109